jgi:hypothetical protein
MSQTGHMVKRSSWPGWMCSVTVPPGTLRQLKRRSSPPLSSAVAVNSIHSPVAGLKKGRKLVTGAIPPRPFTATALMGLCESKLE